MEIAINNNIYQQASDYAQQQGLNITAVIENFLVRFIGRSKVAQQQERIPDIVLSLLGAGDPNADDLNGREAYYQFATLE